jgi:hypothetical protein
MEISYRLGENICKVYIYDKGVWVQNVQRALKTQKDKKANSQLKNREKARCRCLMP